MFTGWNIKLKESEMKESGIDLVVHKPFDVAQVLMIVQEGMLIRERFNAS